MNDLKNKDTFIKKINRTLSDRWKNFIVIIFLFFIIVGVYLYLSYISTPTIVVSSPMQTAISNCEKSASYVDCIDNLAVQTKNVSICNASSTESAKAGCIYDFAKTTDNISACNTINKNINYSTDCFMDLANETKNYSACASLGMPYGATCIYNLLNSSGFSNLTKCNSIQNSTYLTMCKDLYYFENALKNKNSALCKNMSNTTNYDDMISLFNTQKENITIKNYSGNLSSLSIIPYNNYIEFLNFTPRDYCYYSMAQSLNNSQLCSKISKDESRILCNSTFTKVVTPNINLTAPNMTAACINNKNSTLITECNGIYLLKDAFQTGNLTECNKINETPNEVSRASGSALSDNCRFLIALKEENLSICNMISNQSIESNCIRQTSIFINMTASIKNINNTKINNYTNYTAPNVT